jgi:hypothetical protein
MKPFQNKQFSALFKSALVSLLLVASSTATASVYLVSWDPSPEPDLAGYKIYFGSRHRLYTNCLNVGIIEQCMIAIPDTGVFCVSVTAFDTTGNESEYSQEFMLDLRIDIPPSDQFQLLPNYPNPFNPETIIPYRLNRPTKIELAVFDMLGRRVRTLESGEKPAGVHQVLWRGNDDRGVAVANGIYICRLVIGNLYKTTKIMLVR